MYFLRDRPPCTFHTPYNRTSFTAPRSGTYPVLPACAILEPPLTHLVLLLEVTLDLPLLRQQYKVCRHVVRWEVTHVEVVHLDKISWRLGRERWTCRAVHLGDVANGFGSGSHSRMAETEGAGESAGHERLSDAYLELV